MSNTQEIGLIIFGVVVLSIAAASAAYWYENKQAKERKRKLKLEPSSRHLRLWKNEMGIDFDPSDPNDPVAALIAAGEYFRMTGCEPGGPYYEETFKRVLAMMENLVPPDRISFWHDQVYRLYGSGMLGKRVSEGE